MRGVLHLIKLSVGPKDVAALRAIQATRLAGDPPLRHVTRMMPKRLDELLDGGSIYWVVAGLLCVRQRLLDIRPAKGADGTQHTALILDPELVPVEARRMKPFQGWRYLQADSAPPDLAAGAVASGIEELPESLRRELRMLCLI
ncbi:DUF1489 family protein [Roseomonas marmotae]|uniref:DUF1489 domain-containing protein n=1 Tax=Roseomonas marmotae TaxID=2768161 RepID=A0ABS3K7Z3_9PROT|nr:DUF1489 domain-containing protein [Roseomonas marmotae]MBO1073589.1 DUF1489 domain-containing protein [Roseomonas marmotae]QTI80230.1 DUF1489 domain-containing protein [Roseomonas marmotae]